MGNKNQFSSCTVGAYRCKCMDMLSEAEKQFLDSNSLKVSFRKGEILFKQGTLASHVMYVEKGFVKAYMDDGENTLVLKVVPEGNLLGLTTINQDFNAFQYSAMAYVDTEVSQIEIQAFRKIILQNPGFAKEIIDLLSANSIQINSRFFCLIHKQSYGRLADILLCLSSRVFKTPDFCLPLSRKDLAELCGMSTETVIRILKSFTEEGLILIQGKTITILNMDKLISISEKG